MIRRDNIFLNARLAQLAERQVYTLCPDKIRRCWFESNISHWGKYGHIYIDSHRMPVYISSQFNGRTLDFGSKDGSSNLSDEAMLMPT